MVLEKVSVIMDNVIDNIPNPKDVYEVLPEWEIFKNPKGELVMASKDRRMGIDFTKTRTRIRSTGNFGDNLENIMSLRNAILEVAGVCNEKERAKAYLDFSENVNNTFYKAHIKSIDGQPTYNELNFLENNVGMEWIRINDKDFLYTLIRDLRWDDNKNVFVRPFNLALSSYVGTLNDFCKLYSKEKERLSFMDPLKLEGSNMYI